MTQADRWIPIEQRVSNGWAKRLFSSSQPMAGDAISGQSAYSACFLYLSTLLPAGDTPELLCPPEDSVRQADLCAQPWPSHQPPPYYGVSAYWQYYLQLRFTATLSLVSIFLLISASPSLSLWAPDLLTLSFSLWWCPLSVDSRHFRCFLCYDKGITEPLINTRDTPGSPDPGALPHGLLFSKRCTKAGAHTHTGIVSVTFTCSAACCLSHMHSLEINSTELLQYFPKNLTHLILVMAEAQPVMSWARLKADGSADLMREALCNDIIPAVSTKWTGIHCTMCFSIYIALKWLAAGNITFRGQIVPVANWCTWWPSICRKLIDSGTLLLAFPITARI